MVKSNIHSPTVALAWSPSAPVENSSPASHYHLVLDKYIGYNGFFVDNSRLLRVEMMLKAVRMNNNSKAVKTKPNNELKEAKVKLQLCLVFFMIISLGIVVDDVVSKSKTWCKKVPYS